MVPLIEQYIPKGHPNRPGILLESLKAIVFHYTANDAPGATDTINAKYFARKYIKKDSNFFEADGVTPWRYGSTQVLADMDSVTLAIPPNEVSWCAGDRNTLPYTEANKGQKPLAKSLFNNRQNYQVLSIEICNNDVIKNSTEDWDKACDNAADWAINYIRSNELRVDYDHSIDCQSGISKLPPKTILLLRHYDLTGKKCPGPLLDQNIWNDFILNIVSLI